MFRASKEDSLGFWRAECEAVGMSPGFGLSNGPLEAEGHVVRVAAGNIEEAIVSIGIHGNGAVEGFDEFVKNKVPKKGGQNPPLWHPAREETFTDNAFKFDRADTGSEEAEVPLYNVFVKGMECTQRTSDLLSATDIDN